MNLFAAFKGMLSTVIFDGTWLVPDFGWNITSVFFRLIVNANRWFALALMILFISLIECAMSAQSSPNSRSRTSSSVVLVLAF